MKSVVQLHIWDFSGQTTQLFVNDNVGLTNGFVEHSATEVTDMCVICQFFFFLMFLAL